jgi:hypothetical protein
MQLNPSLMRLLGTGLGYDLSYSSYSELWQQTHSDTERKGLSLALIGNRARQSRSPIARRARAGNRIRSGPRPDSSRSTPAGPKPRGPRSNRGGNHSKSSELRNSLDERPRGRNPAAPELHKLPRVSNSRDPEVSGNPHCQKLQESSTARGQSPSSREPPHGEA